MYHKNRSPSLPGHSPTLRPGVPPAPLSFPPRPLLFLFSSSRALTCLSLGHPQSLTTDLDWNPMESSDSTQRLGQPSRIAHSPSYPMALSGSQQPLAHQHRPQFPLVDLSSEKYDPSRCLTPSNHAVPFPTSTFPQHTMPLPPAFSPSLHCGRTAPIAYTRPRGLRIANLLKPWIPIILYAITSLGFLAVIALWKAEVFQGESPDSCACRQLDPRSMYAHLYPRSGLDDFSHWLKSDEYVGYAAIFMLIFITTFRKFCQPKHAILTAE